MVGEAAQGVITPAAHKATHAVGGNDALSPADIGAVGTGDSRLSDSREWSAPTATEAEATQGTSTERRAWSPVRVFQSIASWWNGSAAKTKLDGIQEGAQVNVATNLSYDAATRTLASSTGDDATLPLVITSAAGLSPATAFDAISYGATVDLSMSALDGTFKTISLTGNLTFTTSNRANGRTVTIRLVCDSTQRTLTFPTDWKFVGSKPANIAASKVAVLSLTFFGTADADCIAAYGVQS